MEIIHPIPELSGDICTGLVRQEYWFEGEKQNGFCVFNLQVNGEQWYRFFFDYGVLFWYEVGEPKQYESTINDMYYYPLVDEMARNETLRGRTIKAVVTFEEGNFSEIQVQFSGGATLILQEENDFCTFTITYE